MTTDYDQICPRCGDQFSDADADRLADRVVEHARVKHSHALDRQVVLAHLQGVRPDELDD